MRLLMQRFWADQRAVLSPMALILMVTIVVIGTTVGVVTLRDQIVQEFGDVAGAIGSKRFEREILQRLGRRRVSSDVNVWKWVASDPLIDTQWSDSDGDGKDNFPNSMLDFACLAP